MEVVASCPSTVVNMEPIPGESYFLTEPNTETFKACPLCKSEVKLFFINFNEKLLMCKNTECEYPFGYEEPQYFKENNDMCSENEVMSIRSSYSQSYSYAGSTACWSEIDKMHQLVDNDDGAIDVQEYLLKPKEPTKTKIMRITEDIDKNVKEISNLTHTLSKGNEKKTMLKNRYWIRNLTNLQKRTGAKLVKPTEMKDPKSKDMFGGGELTITIGPADNELSTMKIEIKND